MPSTDHGEYAYARRLNCKCEPCLDVVNRSAKKWRIDRERGRPGRTDATPTRLRIVGMLNQGATFMQMEHVSGISRSVLKHIVYGTMGMPAPEKIQRSTQEKVLALDVDEVLAQRKLVDAVGVRRRIEALEYVGYTKGEIGQAMGKSGALIYEFLEYKKIGTDCLARLDEAYRRLLREGEGTSVRVRWSAYRRDYLPAACWDDEDIDNPSAVPYAAVCVVETCTREVHRYSLCMAHYQQASSEKSLLDPRAYRRFVDRRSQVKVQDKKRLASEVRDLLEMGEADHEAIGSRLGFHPSYIGQIVREFDLQEVS